MIVLFVIIGENDLNMFHLPEFLPSPMYYYSASSSAGDLGNLFIITAPLPIKTGNKMSRA